MRRYVGEIRRRLPTFAGVERLKERRDADGLIRKLCDPDIDTQYEAAAALGELRDPRAVGPLVHMLMSDKYSGVRWKAAESLALIGFPAVPDLIETLKHPDEDVRWKAAIALGEIGDPRAVDPLIGLLRDDDRFVKGRAAYALGKIGGPAVDPLICALREGDGSLRWGAAIALGGIGDPRAIGPLIHALTDKYENVRAEAASALGVIGWDSVGPLIEVLKFATPEMRREIVEVLAELGNSDAIEPLMQLLENAREDERAVAIGALRELGGPLVQPLIESLDRKNGPAVKESVKAALLIHGAARHDGEGQGGAGER
jgi:HEAT repeat protein